MACVTKDGEAGFVEAVSCLHETRFGALSAYFLPVTPR